jgi:hypothetical protein
MPRYSSYGRLDSQQVDDGDTAFQRINSRLRPDQLKPGEVAASQNGRMDVDGAWQVRKGISVYGTPIVAGNSALTLPFYLYDNRTISSATRSITVVTVTTSAAHGFTSGTLVSISGLTGTVSPNGNRTITSTGANTFTFTISGATGSETYSGSGTAGAPILDDTAVNSVYGSCLFSDPATNNTEYIAMATNSTLKLIKISDGSTTNIAYPAAVAISSEVNLIQAFNYLFIFRNGLTALQWDGNFSSPTFTLVDNGAYTQPVIYQATNNTVISSGVVTVTASGHTVAIGDLVRVSDRGTTGLNSLEEYRVYDTTATTFKFKADCADSAATTVAVGQRQSIGLGFTHMPCPDWAIYHQRRLWMPFKYLSTGTSGNPTITARNISDEIIASDILDQNTYDQIENQFRIASGGADYLVALQPFAEDNLIAFTRNSIHLISGVGADLGNAVVREITREVGCCARKSIAQVGSKIMFLSDNGVYGIEFDQLYNLRGVSVPLSEAINPTINSIDPLYIDNAVGIYHDNRYYLAYTPKGSTENNTMIVYNFLNDGWESVDSIRYAGWNVKSFIRAGAGGLNSLYVVNELGGIHLLESGTSAVDTLALTVGGGSNVYRIDSGVTTRQYTFGTMDRKKYNSYELHVQSSDEIESDFNISLETENLDGLVSYGSASSIVGGPIPSGEDESIRARLGNKRAYGAQMIISPTTGRPKIRAIKITGMLAFSSTTSAS